MPGSPWRTGADVLLAGLASGAFVEILLMFSVPALWWALAAAVALVGFFFLRFIPVLVWLDLYLIGLLSSAAGAAFLYAGHL